MGSQPHPLSFLFVNHAPPSCWPLLIKAVLRAFSCPGVHCYTADIVTCRNDNCSLFYFVLFCGFCCCLFVFYCYQVFLLLCALCWLGAQGAAQADFELMLIFSASQVPGFQTRASTMPCCCKFVFCPQALVLVTALSMLFM